MGQQKRSKVGLEQPLIANPSNSSSHKNHSKKNTVQASAFSVVLFYCILIIVSPIVTFFTSKYFLFDSAFGLTAVQSNIWSAALAVIALHIALGLYLYRAYFEGEPKKDAGRKHD